MARVRSPQPVDLTCRRRKSRQLAIGEHRTRQTDGGNETDVREEIATPLLSALGYARGTVEIVAVCIRKY